MSYEVSTGSGRKEQLMLSMLRTIELSKEGAERRREEEALRTNNRAGRQQKKEEKKRPEMKSTLRTIRKEECLHDFGSCCGKERKKEEKKKRQRQRKIKCSSYARTHVRTVKERSMTETATIPSYEAKLNS